MTESAQDASGGRSAAGRSEAKNLNDLLHEIRLTEEPWWDSDWDPLTDPLPGTHPYARVAEDIAGLQGKIDSRDKQLASVRSFIEGMIEEVPALRRQAQAVLDEGGHNAELQRAEIKGRIATRQQLSVLLKRLEQ